MNKENEIQKKLDINADKLERLYLLKKRDNMSITDFENKYGKTDKELNDERRMLKDEYVQLIRN